MNILDKFSYRIKIQYKLLLTFLGIAIFPLIILGIAQDVLFTREAPGQFAFIMVFIIVLIMSIVLAFLAARHFDKAIQTLSIGADMLSKGKLDWRVELKTHDEMEDLAIAFNTMASQLKSSYDGLENRVKEMTTELQGEKNKFESILMSLGEGIIVADEKDRIFIINTMAEKILGINHRDYIGKTYFGCHKNVDDIINLVDLSKTRHIERVVTVDKKTIHINIATIKSDNKMLGVAMIMQDITEEKELEKQKQDFISMITHDIKSPLTSILGFSSLLLNQHKDTMDQRMKDAIETINSSAN
ncbi:PAS domain S-box protein, partial [Candidatus Poribacteria bacterium]|nr:PAS domain S-box protein [Candidatus Poribacteria bacterium]